jgi:hypothetical protein
MTPNTTDFQWYKEKGAPYQKIFNYIKYLDLNQGYRQMQNLRYMRLYGNMEFTGLTMQNFFRAEPSYNVQNRVTLNIVGSMVDTATSKITQNKPRPYFLTDGGDWSLQKKGKKLTKFIDGAFYGSKFYENAAIGFKDAGIFGTGCVKIFQQNGEIKSERIFIDEIMVDDVETIYGTPRQMHQRKWIHKDTLGGVFPGHKGAIDAAMNDLVDGGVNDYMTRNGEMLLVIESWKLPSGKDKDDGRHTISISNETLLDEKWTKDYFPFVFFRWNRKPIGFFGQGIAEQLTGLQLEINKIMRTIQVSMHLVSVPKIFVEASSKIVAAHLNNKIGGIIKYAGTPPTEGKLGTIPVELFSHLDRLYQRAFEVVGISQLAAQSVKPAGLNSGKALRTYDDLESERFQTVEKDYQSQFINAAHIMIDLIKEIADENGGKFNIKVPGKKFLDTIDWTDVHLENDQYMMQIFPTNALSRDPSARLQEVQELLQAGFIAKEDGVKLLDYPDLEGFYNMANAGIEDIERQIELMVDKQEYQSPEPYQNLASGITRMQQAYLRNRTDGAPEEVLDLLRRWMEDAKELIDRANVEMQSQQQQAVMAATAAQQQQAAQAANQPGMGRPEHAPVSDMLPANASGASGTATA